MDTKSVVDRERNALRVHRAALRQGGTLPAAEHPTRGTLVHGLALPLSIVAAVMRDRDLRGPFLKLAGVRVLLVALVAALLFAMGRGRAHERDAGSWARVVAVVALLSAVEAAAVFFTRTWDDWLSFHVSRLAGIAPEVPEPPRRRITFSVKWLLRKLRRKIRGYVVFASGIPVLALLQVVPVVGSWAFTAALTLWAWYWVGVFTAAKNAHAWADDERAASPAMVRSFNARFARGWWWWPLRLYGRIWAWALRGVNAPAAAFERSPASYLGLALTRTALSLPGLYLLTRPIVPVASGRLCAESDPAQRFWAAAPS